MASDELDATTDVVTLADHVDGLGESVARRLDDNGVETVADILIADEGALTDVPYVSETRADLLRGTAERVAGDHVEPREVDFDATESVVSEAAIPLSVRRGEAVLTKSSAYGSVDTYHTTACAQVETNDLVERDTGWAERRDLDECDFCSNPEERAENASSEPDADPLVDPVEVVLEATLGEKLQVTLADRDAWARPWNVIEAPDPVEWESADGDNWHTRRLRMSESASGTAKKAREFDLVLAGDEVRVEDPPVEHVSHQPDAPGWGVKSVGAVGRVTTSSLVQLQADDDQEEAKPEGDDTWRKYQRGEA